MTTTPEQIRLKRNYLPGNFNIDRWESIEPYLQELLDRTIHSADELSQWLIDRSELDSVLEEDAAWRYIRMSCNTEDEALAAHFNDFVTTIEPHIAKYANQLDQKLIKSPFIEQLNQEDFFVLLRSVRKSIELFREENIPVFAELQKEEQEYGRINGAMTIKYDGKELTMQQAANYLKETDRNVREEVYGLILNRRRQDADKLNQLFDRLLQKRRTIALNTGFDNFRDYKHQALGRFDYQVEDVQRFHDTVKEVVCPIVDQLYRKRKASLGVDVLKPWDLQVDPELLPPLKPFSTIEELVENSIKTFTQIRPEFGQYLRIMKDYGYLDLDSRKGKAPGGFNYPLYESNIPFIFMNATSNLRDLETMMHEGGHAVHSFLSSDIQLVNYKETPAEIAELASMSMELITMDEWKQFFEHEHDLKRAWRSQLESVLSVLPWIATIDKFQHWLYTNPEHSSKERSEAWKNIFLEFSSKEVDYTGMEDYFDTFWHRQLHIFEVPFYYIEYGIAQLGAIALWKNYKEHPTKAIDQYVQALKMGYTRPITEIYEVAGISFDFSANYISQLMDFVKDQIEKI